jgi:hypothetical protein
VYCQGADLEATWPVRVERRAQAVSESDQIAKVPDHDLWMAIVDGGEENMAGLMCEVRADE